MPDDPKSDDPQTGSSRPTLDQQTRLASAMASTLVATSYGPAIDPEPAPADDGVFAARYEQGDLLGEGGMGEVRLCKDRRIGREVAIKVIRPGHGSRSDLQKRFVREARVQGQLEHPSIVPVYDLGLTPEPAFFTMKRVRGVTLEEVLDRLRAKDSETVAAFSRRKLLAAFGSVCLAVDFAHARGVVHRDLKPANVMLGDFGEVYVLDWGVAKIGDSEETREPLAIHDEDRNARTATGALMGTLGYMAPEQVRGDEVDARVSVRAPLRDVAPELESICVKATALDPKDRYASARELDVALERYLDGDRDLEQRRAMALGHARIALDAAAKARAKEGGPSAEARSLALREVGRALALDPSNEDALKTLVGLLVDVPGDLPAEAAAEVEASRRDYVRNAGRAATFLYLSWFLYLPFFLWMGVKNGLPLALTMGFVGVSTGVSVVMSRSSREKSREGGYYLLVVSNALGVAFTSRVFGPFVFLPSVAVAMVACFALDPHRRRHRVAIAVTALAFTAPVILEWTGVLARSYVFQGNMMCLVPNVVALPEWPTLVTLLVLSLGAILSTAVFLAHVVAKLSGAERRLHLHAWQLGQMVPRKAIDAPRST